MKKFGRFWNSILLAMLIALATPAAAIGVLYSDLIIVGDSLSETGNYSALIAPSEFPSAPYANGRFSNGPVWVEGLSSMLGLGPVTASGIGGNNYAWGGAQTGGQAGPPGITFTATPPFFALTPIDLGEQAGRYLDDVAGVADPNALYVVWGGGNDVFAGDVSTSADNIFGVIDNLYTAGARNFLVPNLPVNDLISPLFGVFNADLSVALDAAETALPGIALTRLDINQLFTEITIDALFNAGLGFGITNVTDSCLTATSVCGNPENYLLWDSTPHPTARGHELIAAAAFAQVSAVPLPAGLWLLLPALGALATAGHRRQA